MRSFLPFFRQRRSAVLHHQVEICFGHSAVAQTFRAPSAAFCEGVLLLAALHLEKTDAGGDRADHDKNGGQCGDECRWNAAGNMKQLSKGFTGGTIFLISSRFGRIGERQGLRGAV